jgi:outer membrane scaffolding protein for murein synthesis (MipA/OmpV family)
VGRSARRLAAIGLAVLVSAAHAQDAAPVEAKVRFEGAVGLIVNRGSAFSGSSDISTSVTPAGFIRYGRFTLSGAGGFTTKNDDDVDRGFSGELLDRDDLRLSLSLRYDNGRKEGDSPDLAGMGNIAPTGRARLIARWRPAPGWRVNAGVGVDAINGFGGLLVDGSVAREWRPGPGQTVTLSAGLSGAGGNYMQTWFGVTPDQSAESGYAVYEPGSGLIGARLAAEWRAEFEYSLAGYVNVGVGRLLGPAADSPLTKRPGGTGLGAGLVWRF